MKTFLKTFGSIALLSFLLNSGPPLHAQDDSSAYTGMSGNASADPAQGAYAQDNAAAYTGTGTAENNSGSVINTTAAINTAATSPDPAINNSPNADTPSGPIAAPGVNSNASNATTANGSANPGNPNAGNANGVSPNPNLDNNNVTFQTFYDQLAPLGTWIQTTQYGYVFQPKINDPNWRPYTYGHWVHTDNGMLWDSDEPFGWATYHYGRWVNLANDGWVWVPGYTWAPAWVSWRESDDDYGWAPLPPESDLGIDFFDGDAAFGFHIGDDCDEAYDIGPWWYNFCPVAYIGDPYAWRHFRDRRDNFALIGRTHNITNINTVNDPRGGHLGRFGRVNSGGPALADLNRHSKIAVRQATLTSASTLGENGRVHNGTLAVFAPSVDPSSVKTARPHEVDRTLTTASVNHGASINQPLATTSGLRSVAATPGQIHAATLAHAPTGARVATADTHPARSLSQPLTSFQVNNREAAHQAEVHQAAIQTPAASTAIHQPAGAGEEVAHNPAGGSFYHSFFGGGTAPASAITPKTAPVEHASSTSVVHASSAPVFHASSAPVFHPAPAYHPQPAFHAVGPVLHSAPASHPAAQAAAHVGGGGHSGGGSPAAHAGGGGGHPSAAAGPAKHH